MGKSFIVRDISGLCLRHLIKILSSWKKSIFTLLFSVQMLILSTYQFQPANSPTWTFTSYW